MQGIQFNGLVDPLLIDDVVRLDEVKLATQEEMPSRYPIYAVIITQEEVTMETLMV